MSTEGRLIVRALIPSGGVCEVVRSPKNNRDKPGDVVEVWRRDAGPIYVKLRSVFDRPRKGGVVRFSFGREDGSDLPPKEPSLREQAALDAYAACRDMAARGSSYYENPYHGQSKMHAEWRRGYLDYWKR